MNDLYIKYNRFYIQHLFLDESFFIGDRMSKTIYQMIKDMEDRIFSLIYPKRCPICDKILNPEEQEIHSSCKKNIYYVSNPSCMRCGRPVENASYELCYPCHSDKDFIQTYSNQKHNSQERFVPSFSYIRQNQYRRKQQEELDFHGKAVFLYKGSIKISLYRFKYSNKREYAKFFAKEAVRLYGMWIRQNGIELIVPIPMHKKKQRKRGYNQAESFARELSILTRIPIDTHLLERIKDTIPQKNLNKQERKNNLKNAFQTTKSIVQYTQRILIVDDIYTTGSTMQAVTACLKEAGAEKIFILSIAIGT